jgi:hypothetical protein
VLQSSGTIPARILLDDLEATRRSFPQDVRDKILDGKLPRSVAPAVNHTEANPHLFYRAPRTFAIITTDANEVVAEIHDRMPLILAHADYTRWLSDEPDPGDLMRLFPAEPMRMWPISTRVNKPENDDPSIVEPIAIATSAA